jgi:SAM-dependent methyltransferase
MNWKHGYYADEGYTYGFYPETVIDRINWACLLQGHKPPSGSFRYLDAGCGQGLSVILMAAANPNSEFVGIDFLPEHIAHARSLASQARINNVSFIEGDFIELAHTPSTLGKFDYVVCHGISTWIAPSVKDALFRLVGHALNPGGILYNSYNTFPGWLPMVPFQNLVLLEQGTKNGPAALEQALVSMQSISQHAPGMFAALPGLTPRLKGMASQDSAYLVQEYNNRYWQPVFVSQMIAELATHKLSYLGTATLPEAFDSLLSDPVREMLRGASSSAIREQLRDYAANQSFRRDLYVKGRIKSWPLEQDEQVKSFRLIINPMNTWPEKGQPFVVRIGQTELHGDPIHWNNILDCVRSSESGATVGEVIKAVAPDHQKGVVSAISMLLHGGWLLPYREITDSIGTQLNRVLAAAVVNGAPYRFISAPACGGALPMTDVDWFILKTAFSDIPRERWVDEVSAVMVRLGRTISKNGSVVTDPSDRQRMLTEAIAEMQLTKLPFLARVGSVLRSDFESLPHPSTP